MRRAGAAAARAASTAAIFRESAANKTGLSHALDGTMRSGAHDMKVFGAGTLAALASRSRALEFLQGHRHVYCAMEQHLDACAPGSATGALWQRVGGALRRGEALTSDVVALGGSVHAAPSPATRSYVQRLAAAAAAPVPLLLSHFYVRYFADLFGGSVLGMPTRAALQLPATPAFYVHSATVTSDRRAFIESLYSALNAAGAGLSESETKALVAEAEAAFAANAELYREAAPAGTGLAGLFGLAVVGGARVAGGLALEKLKGR